MAAHSIGSGRAWIPTLFQARASSTARSARAPTSRFIALVAMAFSASSVNTSVAPSILNRCWYCLMIALRGSLMMRMSASRPSSRSVPLSGAARSQNVRVGDDVSRNAAWSYPDPTPAFREIAGYLSFYPAKLQCTVDGERVRPQPGDFYGGWITDEITGPFKGEPGTGHW